MQITYSLTRTTVSAGKTCVPLKHIFEKYHKPCIIYSLDKIVGKFSPNRSYTTVLFSSEM